MWKKQSHNVEIVCIDVGVRLAAKERRLNHPVTSTLLLELGWGIIGGRRKALRVHRGSDREDTRDEQDAKRKGLTKEGQRGCCGVGFVLTNYSRCMEIGCWEGYNNIMEASRLGFRGNKMTGRDSQGSPCLRKGRWSPPCLYWRGGEDKKSPSTPFWIHLTV
jgi:hypothetical protein